MLQSITATVIKCVVPRMITSSFGTATAGEQAASRIVAVNGERHQQRQEAQHNAGSERVEPAMDRLPALVSCALDAGLSKGTQLTPVLRNRGSLMSRRQACQDQPAKARLSSPPPCRPAP